jgi:hypothetical protein
LPIHILDIHQIEEIQSPSSQPKRDPEPNDPHVHPETQADGQQHTQANKRGLQINYHLCNIASDSHNSVIHAQDKLWYQRQAIDPDQLSKQPFDILQTGINACDAHPKPIHQTSTNYPNATHNENIKPINIFCLVKFATAQEIPNICPKHIANTEASIIDNAHNIHKTDKRRNLTLVVGQTAQVSVRLKA